MTIISCTLQTKKHNEITQTYTSPLGDYSWEARLIIWQTAPSIRHSLLPLLVTAHLTRAGGNCAPERHATSVTSISATRRSLLRGFTWFHHLLLILSKYRRVVTVLRNAVCFTVMGIFLKLSPCALKQVTPLIKLDDIAESLRIATWKSSQGIDTKAGGENKEYSYL